MCKDHILSQCIDYNAKFYNRDSGSWVAGSETNPYIQADLITPRRIYGVTTQGRPDWEQWVTSYYISYSLDGSVWTDFANAFTGNYDQNTRVTTVLTPGGVTARYIRLYPDGFYDDRSLRWDIIGCRACTASYMLCNGTPDVVVATVASSYFDADLRSQNSCLDSEASGMHIRKCTHNTLYF